MEAMGTSSIPLVAAFFIGLMTAISPCPLATNVTAIAYVSRRVGNTRGILISGVLYTLGRALSYTLIAASIVYLGLSAEVIGRFLQSYGPVLLGPVLLVIGIVLLDVVSLPSFKGAKWFDRAKERLAGGGYGGSFLLGALLALAFCPFSGVLFFGMLLPLALRTGDAVAVPLVFGVATGLPVLLVALLLASGAGALGKVLDMTRVFERWFRRVAGGVFVIVGLYYSFISFL